MAALAKTIGALLALLGVLALLVGIAVAGYAFFDYSNERRDMFRDQDREEADMAMMAGGAVVAALGLVLFLAGLVTLVASRPKPIAASPDQAISPMPAKPRSAEPAPLSLGGYATSPRGAVVAAVVGILAVLLLVAAIVFVQSGGDAFTLNGSPDPPPVTYLDETHNGTVQGGSLGAGVPAFSFGPSDGAFTVPAQADACRLTLDWDPSAPGGTGSLRLEVERDATQVAQEAGGPGFELDLPTPVAPGPHSFAVFTEEAGSVASQEFLLRVHCVGPPR